MSLPQVVKPLASTPYVPMARPLPVRPPVGSPSYAKIGINGASWLLILSPIAIILGAWLVFSLRGTATAADVLGSLAAVWGISASVFVLSIFAVIADRRYLQNNGLEAPSGWWVLLSILAYLAARGVTLNRQGVPGYTPLALYIVALVLGSMVSGGAIGPMLVSSLMSASVADVEKSFAESLASQTTTTWVVECPDDAPLSTPNSSFTCLGTDSSGLVLNISALIDGRGQISFTATRAAATSS